MLHREQRLKDHPTLVKVSEAVESAGLDSDDAFDAFEALFRHKDARAMLDEMRGALEKPTDPSVYREICLRLIYTLCISDHLGDVADAVRSTLEKLGVDKAKINECNSLTEISDLLEREKIINKGVWGD